MPPRKKKPSNEYESVMSVAEAKLLVRAKKRAETGFEAVSHDFEQATDDLKFCNNEGHWDETILAERQEAGRPCLVFNHSVPYTRDVIGEQRESRPHTTVKPVDGKASQEVAKIKEDYLRNRKYKCKADNAYDIGFGQQLRGGFGFYRIHTEFEKGNGFNQTFSIKPHLNQFTVVYDDNAEEWHKNDGEWMGIITHLDRDVLEAEYDAPISNFDTSSARWYPTKDKATVMEYYEKEHFKQLMFQLNDGQVIKESEVPEGVEAKIGVTWRNPDFKPGDPASEPEFEIVKSRKVDDYKIYRYLLCGHKILEAKEEWPCKYWPMIPIEGDVIIVEGKVHRRSLIRFSKDPNRAYNMSRCTELEALSLVPKAPVMGTPAMFEGFESQWDNSNKATYSRLLVNPDPMFPGTMPQRLSGIDPAYVAAVAQSSLQAKEEIRQTIGPNILLPKMGEGMGNVSSLSIGKWQKEGDVSTFIFVDNLQRAIEWGDQVCVELMSRIMDTQRTITCRKLDGSTYEEVINRKEVDPETFEEKVINDMTVGEYSAETSLGPSYAAQRAEIGDKMLLFVQTIPALATATADVLAAMLFDSSQSGGAQGGILDELVKRVKKYLLKSGLIDPTDLKEDELKEFAPLLMQPPKPMPPELLAKLKTEAAKAMELMARAEKTMAETGSIKAETSQQIMQMFTMLGMMAMQPLQQPQQEEQKSLPKPQGVVQG